jgi:hypothetical protein
MRCRGLARSLAAGPLVARRAFWLIDRLLVPDTRVKFRFPDSSRVPGLPPAWCPSPAVTYFYCPEPRWHKGFRALISRFFRCPQNVHSEGHVVPRRWHFSTGPSTASAQATPGRPAIARPRQPGARAGRSPRRTEAGAGRSRCWPEPAQDRPAQDAFRALADAAGWLPCSPPHRPVRSSASPPHRPCALSFLPRRRQPASPSARGSVNDTFTSRSVKIIFTT